MENLSPARKKEEEKKITRINFRQNVMNKKKQYKIENK